MVYMIESQIAHALNALREMDERGVETLEVRPEAYESYNSEIDAEMPGTVWNTGCASWYVDKTGRISTIWPDWTWRFRRRAARFEPAAYVLGAREPAASQPEAVPA
jgi:hypothetical protein